MGFSKSSLYAIPRTKRPLRPDNAEEILDERVENAFDENTMQPHNKREGDDPEGWVVDDDICTDGGTVVGFLDTSHPQPWDNSQRLYTVDDSHITRPLVKIDDQRSASTYSPDRVYSAFRLIRRKRRFARVWRRSASRILQSGFCSSWIISLHTCVSIRESRLTRLVSISSFSLLAHLISTQSSKSGRASNGNPHR